MFFKITNKPLLKYMKKNAEFLRGYLQIDLLLEQVMLFKIFDSKWYEVLRNIFFVKDGFLEVYGPHNVLI